eukprot:453302-Prorocentrum_minimum.AAC.1
MSEIWREAVTISIRRPQKRRSVTISMQSKEHIPIRATEEAYHELDAVGTSLIRATEEVKHITLSI